MIYCITVWEFFINMHCDLKKKLNEKAIENIKINNILVNKTVFFSGYYASSKLKRKRKHTVY